MMNPPPIPSILCKTSRKVVVPNFHDGFQFTAATCAIDSKNVHSEVSCAKSLRHSRTFVAVKVLSCTKFRF